MKVTGYGLREAIRRWQLSRDAAANMFEDSLKKFPNEDKPDPMSVAIDFYAADLAIAKLQVAQKQYNLAVTVLVLEETMTLAEAVSRIGGAGRLEKMWRSAAVPKRDRYGSSVREIMTKDEVMSVYQIQKSVMLKEAESRARVAAALRFAVAQGNVTEVDVQVQGLDPSMLA